ncbi:MAG: hypothetical protein V4469_01895 [Patescibacteria group bacterium]
MILTLFGTLLLLLPFLVVISSDNRPRTFTYVFAGSTALYLTLAIATQLFHIFFYGVILTLHIILLGFWLWYAYRKKWLSKPVRMRPHWYIIVLCLFALIFLTSIHFDYTGAVDSVSGLRYVKSSSYPYPFYSDEWVAVSLINFTITNHSLPLVNPLFENSSFPNFLFVFHSLFAYFFLILNLTVLTHYVFFAILNTILILIFAYWLLRLFNLSRFASFLSALTLLFMTNSGNLPGLWNLLPYNVSILFLIIGMIGYLTESVWLYYIGLVVAFVVYPPALIFIVPLMLASVSKKDKDWCKKINKKYYYITGGVLVFALLISEYFHLFSFVFRRKLDLGIVYYEPWNILPFIIIPFVCIGVWNVWKGKISIILWPMFVGLVLWVVSIFIPFVFIIEQNRVVVITSVFLVLSGAFGIDTLIHYLKNKFGDVFDRQGILFLKVILFIFYVLMAVFSSHFGMWHKLVLKSDIGGNHQFVPAPPVTRYLTPNDLSLFKDIHGQRFIAPSWKGLVIGAATGNFPLDSKTSTISNVYLHYEDFVNAGCDEKQSLISKYRISYAYIASTTCKTFREIGRGSEGLVLYKLK